MEKRPEIKPNTPRVITIVDPKSVYCMLDELVDVLHESNDPNAVMVAFFEGEGEDGLEERDSKALGEFREIWLQEPEQLKQFVEAVGFGFDLIGDRFTDCSYQLRSELVYWIATRASHIPVRDGIGADQREHHLA